MLSCIHITRTPNIAVLQFAAAIFLYGATFICDALAHFIVTYQDSSLTPMEIEHQARGIFFQFAVVPTFHKLKFILKDAQHLGIIETTWDTAHAHPAQRDKHNHVVPACFDTVLINDGMGGLVRAQGL